MDTYIRLDTSCGCRSLMLTEIIDILWENHISNEARAFDDEVFILGTTQAEHDTIESQIRLNLPETWIADISKEKRYNGSPT